jgi:UDP-N-acetylmuramyl tripeptide synthase
MMDIIQEIDKKFYNVYRNNKEMMKKYFEKNEEELKLRYALEHIKKDHIILITLLKIFRLVY